MKARYAAIPLALIIAPLLTGCGDNAGACERFEGAYNQSDLRDKKLFSDSDAYNQSLYDLTASAEIAEEAASGGVKEALESFNANADAYRYDQENPEESSYDMLLLRGVVTETRDEIVDACKGSGNAIELEEDRPIQ